MHGFNLVLGSVLAYSWSKNLVVRAQQVVTYFRASHAPLAALRKAAEELQITQGLQSSNTTRFTSNYACTSSVQGHAPAFTLVKQRGSVVITNQDVAATLEDAAFWADLAKLNKVLKPISRVVMVVQGDSTTMADICRCVLHGLVSAVAHEQRLIVWTGAGLLVRTVKISGHVQHQHLTGLLSTVPSVHAVAVAQVLAVPGKGAG